MPEAGEIAELRSLQERAYGRGGGLSEAEAARLRELEVLRAASSAEAGGPRSEAARTHGVPAVSAAQGADALAEVGRADVLPVAEGDAEAPGPSRSGLARGEMSPSASNGVPSASAERVPVDDEAPPGGDGESPGRGLLRLWRQLSVTAVLLVGLGLGFGWVAFARHGADEIALTPEQESWRTAILAEGEYDSNSLHALREEEGVIAWVATRDDGESSCLLLGDDGTPTPFCTAAKQVEEQGVFGGISRERDGRRVDVNAQLLFTASGEPALAMMSYETTSPSGITYATEEEARIARRLAEQGYDQNSLWVVGYDGDLSVWTGVKVEAQESCLIVSGAQPEADAACQGLATEPGDDLLRVTVKDPDSGAETEYVYGTTTTGPATLQIIRSAP